MVALHKGRTNKRDEQVHTSTQVQTHADDAEEQVLQPAALMTVHFGTIFDRTKSGTCTHRQKSAGIGRHPGADSWGGLLLQQR